ncbi:MAG: TlyA family RNA methyltransferase [Coriobacteriia bacterium]|nr:TlyA family RNA methyltransferase [Coriobacteriia bacterium]
MSARRLDAELVERGLASSQEQACGLILAGDVTVDGTVVSKAGTPVSAGARVRVAEQRRYVSRGGYKLAGALDTFGIDPAGVAAIDVGSSTGGFTDCLLQRGAVSVTAVDVGYGQLAWQLRNDPRVQVLERTNIRTADREVLGDGYGLAVIDVSFIGLAKVLPTVGSLLTSDAGCLALVKPQFEAGKARIGKKGVVRDAVVHRDILLEVLTGAEGEGWSVRGLTWSPITGPEGNIEFWAWLGVGGESKAVDVPGIVEAAHAALGG